MAGGPDQQSVHVPGGCDSFRDARQLCEQRHKDLGTCVTDIKVTLGRMDERMKNAFGELEDGETIFADHKTRLEKIERLIERGRGVVILLVFLGSILGSILVTIGGKVLDKIF